MGGASLSLKDRPLRRRDPYNANESFAVIIHKSMISPEAPCDLFAVINKTLSPDELMHNVFAKVRQ